MKNQRLVNFRPFLIVAMIMAMSVLFSLLAFNILPLGIVLLSLLLAGAATGAIYFSVKRDTVKCIAFLLGFVLSVVMIVMFFSTLAARYSLDPSQEYIIGGRVTEHCAIEEDGTLVATLDNLTANENRVDGKLRVYIEDGGEFDYLQCGYKVSFVSPVTLNQLVDGFTVNAQGIRNDVRYYAFPDELYVFSPGEAKGMERARLAVRDLIENKMGVASGGVAYGMLVGDRQLLTDDISAYFAASGIGHILAVSGLHIGALVGALSLLLKKCRVPKPAVTLLLLATILLYAIFTGGSPSVLRAIIMTTVMLLAPYFGRRDTLNSLCFAAAVCLTISPFYLFETGFVMSFSAVLGLTLFSKPINAALLRLKMPQRAAAGLSSSASVQAAITPATAFFFHSFNTYSLLVNAIMLPLLSLLFVLTFMATVVSLIVPPLAFLLTGVGWAIGGVCSVCAFVSGLPLASIVVHSLPLIFLMLPLMFVASKYFMTQRKGLIALVAIALMLVMPVLSNNAFSYDNSMVALKYGETVIFGEDTYVVGTFVGNTTRALFDARIRGELVLVVIDMNEKSARGIIELARTYQIREVVFADEESVSGVKTLVDAGFNLKMTNNYKQFSVARLNGAARGWLYDSGNGVAYITNKYSGSDAEIAADIVRCRGSYEGDDKHVYFTSYRSNDDYDNVYPVTVYGNIVYEFSSGKIYGYT